MGQVKPDVLSLSPEAHRNQRIARFKHCMRYPSPYKAELTESLKDLKPDPEMVLESGYYILDLLDLQLGWDELREIGFTEADLYQMGLKYEMTQRDSIYASLLNIPMASPPSKEGEGEEVEEDPYYL